LLEKYLDGSLLNRVLLQLLLHILLTSSSLSSAAFSLATVLVPISVLLLLLLLEVGGLVSSLFNRAKLVSLLLVSFSVSFVSTGLPSVAQ
jgi:hypothetical protein